MSRVDRAGIGIGEGLRSEGSVLVFCQHTGNAGPADGSASYRCSDDGEYFTIVLSKTLYGQFHRARQSAGAAGKKAASGLIVLPPLALLIKDLSTVDPDSPNLTTAQRRLFKLLESCGIAELNASTPHLEVAMKLLENSKVLATCFEKIS